MKIFSLKVVFTLFVTGHLVNAKTSKIETDEDLFFSNDAGKNIENEVREEDISMDAVKNFLPIQKRPYKVNGSPITAYYMSTNSKVPSEYVRADIEHTAMNNLRLRQLFINSKEKFEKLFRAIQKIEEELNVTNSLIDSYGEDTKTRIDDIKEQMKDSFESVNMDVHSLGTKLGVLTNTVDNNEKKTGQSLQSLGEETGQLKEGSGKVIEMITGLLGKVNKVKIKDCDGENRNPWSDNSEEKEETVQEEPKNDN